MSGDLDSLDGDNASRFRIGAIKKIMKIDDEVELIAQDAVFTVSKATELFIMSLVKDVLSANPAKKIIDKNDIYCIIQKYEFLDEMI